MPLQKCQSCGYWVDPSVGGCPNCGILAPSGGVRKGGRQFDARRNGSILVFATIGLVIGVLVGSRKSDGDLITWMVWSLSGLICGWPAGDLLNSVLGRVFANARSRFSPTHSENCLRVEEKRLRQSLAHETRRMHGIRAQRQQRSREGASEESDGSRNLAEREREVAASVATLQCRLWQIAASRWENQFEWICSDPSGITDRECGLRLLTLSSAGARIEALARNWERSPYSGTKTGRECIRRVHALLERSNAMKAVLQARSGVRPVVSIMPALDISLPQRAEPARASITPEPYPQPNVRMAPSRVEPDKPYEDISTHSTVIDMPSLAPKQSRRRLV